MMHKSSVEFQHTRARRVTNENAQPLSGATAGRGIVFEAGNADAVELRRSI